jgi:serine/threonine protein phosphatase PrpC
MQLASHRDLNRAAGELISKAVARGTQDNTSVVIVAFHQFE